MAKTNRTERKMIDAIDRLAEFEKFEREVAPKLRKMIEAGASAPEIYEFAQALAAARAVTIAMTEPDSAKALAAVKDLLDRTQGKARERVDVRHKYENMRDEELDALLKSKLAESSSAGDSDTH